MVSLIIYVWFIVLPSSIFTRELNATSSETITKKHGDFVVFSWKIDTSKSYNITCHITKDEQVIYIGKWSKDKVDINDEIAYIYGKRLVASSSSGEIQIKMSNLLFNDSGKYHCRYPNYTSVKDLMVVGGPLYDSGNFPSGVYHTKSEKLVKFDVVYCGNPKPSVTWYLNDVSFTSNAAAVLQKNKAEISSNSSITDATMFCYRYTFVSPKLSGKNCKYDLKYTVKGFLESVNKSALVVVSPEMKKLQNVRTGRVNGCLRTQWDGPTVYPGDCETAVKYDIRIQMKSGAEYVHSIYSSTFEVCNDTINVNGVLRITVRQRYLFVNGTYTNSSFMTKIQPELTNNTVKMSESISLLVTTAVLGVLLLMFLLFSIFFLSRRYCTDATDEETENIRTRNTVTGEKDCDRPVVRTKQKKIKKETIIHKPQPLSQVVGRPVTKSHTFSGTHNSINQYADENLMEKGYMPLNTLQKRITESLQAYGQINYVRSNYNQYQTHKTNVVIENHNTNNGRERTESPYCIPGATRAFTVSGNMQKNLSRMGSLDSLDNLDSVYEKRNSIYDLPRTETFSLQANSEKQYQSMYDLANIQSWPEDGEKSQYNRPRSVSSVIYDTPRNTVYIPEATSDSEDGITNASFDSPKVSRVSALYDIAAASLGKDDRLQKLKSPQRKESFSLAIEKSKVDSSLVFDFYDVDVPRSHPKETVYDNLNLTATLSQKDMNSSVKIYEKVGGKLFYPNSDSNV